MGHSLGACLFALFLAATPAFDVASITPSATAREGGEGSGRERVAVTPTGVTLSNAGLSFAIAWAYNLRYYQVSGPDWTVANRYDIVGKAGRAAGTDELRLMMQALLADRFRLKLHREPKNQAVYELLAGRNQMRLRPTQAQQDVPTRVVNGAFVFEHVSMPALAEHLSELAAINRPVLDRTGIKGTYDLTLPGAAQRMLDDPGSIFSAVEDAGLSLRSTTGPVEMLIVDHAEKPTRN